MDLSYFECPTEQAKSACRSRRGPWEDRAARARVTRRLAQNRPPSPPCTPQLHPETGAAKFPTSLLPSLQHQFLAHEPGPALRETWKEADKRARTSSPAGRAGARDMRRYPFLVPRLLDGFKKLSSAFSDA